MKKWLPFFFVGVVAVQAGKEDEKNQEMGRVIETVRDRSRALVCVTPKAFPMNAAVAVACAPPSAPSNAVLATIGPHEMHFIKVYVTPGAEQTLLDGKGVYPPGTLIVKEKCGDSTATDTELFTAMIKHKHGYNPSAGDWEFMVLDKYALIVAHGKIDSCMDCHQHFAKTDFLSRVYLQSVAVAK